MQLVVPLRDLVDEETTFMTARSERDENGCLNAIIAAAPRNPVLLNTLARMGQWYRNEIPQQGLLGPTTMRHGLEVAMKESCPEYNWGNAYMQFKCGPTHAFRLFTEQLIGWGYCSYWGPVLCPRLRASSQFAGLKFGLFDGRKDGKWVLTRPSEDDIAMRQKRFIGWPRFDGCVGFGCGMEGGSPTLMQMRDWQLSAR